MPIQLTTPYAVGDMDVGSPYSQVKILQLNMNVEGGLIDLVVQHGNTVASVWVPSVAIEDKTVRRFRITGTDYDTLVASQSAAVGEVYYDKVAEKLYQWLLDNDHYVGTIV